MKKIFLILLFLIICYDTFWVFNFEKVYKNVSTLSIEAEIISIPEEKSNCNKYIVKTIESSQKRNLVGTNIIAYIEKNISLSPGDIIYLEGEFSKAEGRRNYGGFSYNNYLKQKKIYGMIYVKSIKRIKKKHDLYFLLGFIKQNINHKINLLYENDEADFLKSILIGDKDELSDEIKNNFRNSSLSHILAISGMHISYIVLALKQILKRIIKNKKMQNRLLIIFLMFFSILTGLQPSCIRACIMNSLILISENIYSKNSIYISILISFILLILINPYNIYSVGMWLSFMGTLGIILFSNFFSRIFIYIINKKIKNERHKKVFSYFINLFTVCISAQIMILPIMVYNFNTYSLTYFISNILSSLIIGPILIIGYLSVISSYFFIPISRIMAIFEKALIKLLFFITKFCSKLPFSSIITITPSIITIILYYLIIAIIVFYYYKKRISILKFILSLSKKREIKKYIFKLKKYSKKIYKIIVIFLIILILIKSMLINSNLKIYFVDVGQGDCTVIKTPKGKSILIDGGEGGDKSKYDYGENVVIPYLLDRKIKKIDYVIISHFDNDHVGGLLTVMEELRVDTAIISKQGEDSENYRKFREIVKKKKIKVQVVGQGDRIKIENDLYFDILWPNNDNLISDNVLNNNSIVCKLNYKSFSMLFTGDIEEIAEKKLLEEYKNKIQILNATILKVGHHGSKTSSTQNFIEAVNPQIVLIGVGENNKFGHPNESVIERLELLGSKIYRTDKMGEISVEIDKKGKIRVKKFIQ